MKKTGNEISQFASRPLVSTEAPKTGRPPKPVPEHGGPPIVSEAPRDAYRLIKEAAAAGAKLENIAAQLGTSKKVLRRWMMQDERLQIAFAMGREKDRQELEALIRRDAREGDRPNLNAFFLLKTRHGYQEGDPQDDGVQRVNITVNIPAPMSEDDYMRTVSHQ